MMGMCGSCGVRPRDGRGAFIVGSAPPPSVGGRRREELSDFLRTRRAAIKPEDVGLPTGGRRRTPGLRREEVAQRAGVGLSWYTWLEQGRDVTPSPQVLNAIGRALHLGPSEVEHLHLLAGSAPSASARLYAAAIDDDTVALVNGLAPHAAFVLGPRFDVLAHNRAAEVVMQDLVSAAAAQRNVLTWLFHPEAGWDEAGTDWRATARANLLDFRAEHARHPGDPTFAALVAELSGRSATFREWWAEHDVQVLEPVRKQIMHKMWGPLSLLQMQTRPAHRPSLRLRILVPADTATRAVLAAIAADGRPISAR